MLTPGFLSLMRNLWKTGSIAASVFPVAVGEMRRTFFPSMMWGISILWGSVGSVNPLSSRSLLTGRQRFEKAFSVKLTQLEITGPRPIKTMSTPLWGVEEGGA
jgi:hypothetical protein